MIDLNGHQTKLQKIDLLLQEQGWDVENRSQVIIEVDTQQSDFPLTKENCTSTNK